MLKHPIAVATRCFGQPIKQSIDTAMITGASGIQLDARNELKPSSLTETGRRQFLHELDERDLKISSLHFATRRAFYDLDQLDARTAATCAAMEFAFQMKATVLTIRLGRIPDEESIEYSTLCQVLDDLARHSNRVGTTLAITPTNDSPESLSRLLTKVDSGPLGINFDPASFVMSSIDAAAAFRELYKWILHFTVRDGLKDIDGSGFEVAVGRGDVNWEECIALLEEADYRGWLTVERNQGDNKPLEMANAIQYLNNVAMG
ncbi:MAG: hypothetical protein CMJ78_02780 [Planctomycetaceae bacterium]|nr:hypothetical protein [Planctomycetaceae bacterium]